MTLKLLEPAFLIRQLLRTAFEGPADDELPLEEYLTAVSRGTAVKFSRPAVSRGTAGAIGSSLESEKEGVPKTVVAIAAGPV